MHVGLMAGPQMGHGAQPQAVAAAGTAAPTGHAAPVSMPHVQPGHAQQKVRADGSGDHAVMHACVFILAVGVAVLGLVVVAWIGFAGFVDSMTSTYRVVWRRNRAPPWTMPSLAKLSILRV